jgi:hypothetical protein
VDRQDDQIGHPFERPRLPVSRSACGQALTSSADDEIAFGLGRPLGDVDHVRDPDLALLTFRDGRRDRSGPLAGGAAQVVLGVLLVARSRPV